MLNWITACQEVALLKYIFVISYIQAVIKIDCEVTHQVFLSKFLQLIN